jgi:uncharacterized cupredoxin-like copper-binding protein
MEHAFPHATGLELKRSMIQTTRIRRLLAAGLSVALLSACGGLPASPRALTIQAQEFAFAPKTLTMSSEETVKLTFENKGTVLHDFVVADIEAEVIEQEGGMTHEPPPVNAPIAFKRHGGPPAIHLAVEPGHTASVTFIPHEVGEYAFYCTVPGHREAGMSGTLTVNR